MSSLEQFYVANDAFSFEYRTSSSSILFQSYPLRSTILPGAVRALSPPG